MMDAENVNRQTEVDGFLDIPPLVTKQAQSFYEQHMNELMFIAGESMVIEKLESTVESVSAAVLPDMEPRDAFPALWDMVDEVSQANDKNWKIRSEVIVCRYVDNYTVFIAETIAAMMRAKPETLRSAETVELTDVLAHESMESLIDWLVEDKVNRLSFKGFNEISKYCQSRFGFPLVESKRLRRQLVHSISKRNLLVHRRGIVDRRLVEALQREGIALDGYTVGQPVENLRHAEVMETVLASVKEIDSRAASKFGLATAPFDTSTFDQSRREES